ncbi:MAG: GspE/PulE family protein, partial [Candidatus Paceibacterota bacterium]
MIIKTMPDDLSKKRETQIKALWQESKERATQIFAEKNNLLYINLRKAPIETSALSCIPEETAKRAKIAAFQKIGKQIKVAVLDYSNPETIKIISQLRNEGNKVTVFLVTEESMNWVLSHYRFIHPRQQEVGQFIDVTSVKPIEFNELNQALLPLTSEEVSSMVSLILKAAVLIDASDVHIEPQDKQTLIRFRVDGVLYDVAKVDEKKSKNIQQRLKLLSGIKINIFNIPQNGRFTIQNENDFIDVRASSLPAPDGEFLVFRLLNPKWIAYGLNDLGMSKKGIKTFTSFLSAPNGMILATGPTGCGKTTTLYAFIREKVSPGIKIITIEDPIEYYIPSVNQTQITNKYDFATGLKSIMRQDPDVIMIGEIRDKETAKIAVQAALTGHLVFSTLHTNEASGAISRLRELEVDASLLPDSLKIVIGQRLVRRLCPHCKEKVKLPDEEKEKLIEAFSILSPKSEVKTPKDIPFIFKAKGCEKCHWLGYKEQIGIFEFFSLTPRIIQAIEQGADQ